mmetsp:Transcript_110054/g.350556  ORF Transcript_110054/g.350556 Transcript_110054/m.350556 type:complete len:533 (+) Transcript_110054:553-2151(+)
MAEQSVLQQLLIALLDLCVLLAALVRRAHIFAKVLRTTLCDDDGYRLAGATFLVCLVLGRGERDECRHLPILGRLVARQELGELARRGGEQAVPDRRDVGAVLDARHRWQAPDVVGRQLELLGVSLDAKESVDVVGASGRCVPLRLQQALRRATELLDCDLVKQLAVRDLDACRRDHGMPGFDNALPAGHLHTGGTTVLHQNLCDRSPDQDGASGRVDGIDEHLRKHFAAPHGREAALGHVVRQDAGMQEERCLVWRHAVVAKLGRDGRPKHTIHQSAIRHSLREAAAHVPRGDQLDRPGKSKQRLPEPRGHELLADDEAHASSRDVHLPEEPPNRTLLAGVLLDEVPHEGFRPGPVAVRARARCMELVVHLRAVVLSLPLHLESSAVPCCEVHHGRELCGAADVVHSGIEFVALIFEGVRAAAGDVVLLQNDHAPADLGEQSCQVEARQAAADDHVVDLLWKLLRGEADTQHILIGRQLRRSTLGMLTHGAPLPVTEPAACCKDGPCSRHAGQRLVSSRALLEGPRHGRVR